MNILPIIGRSRELFTEDMQANEPLVSDKVSSGRFLVVGGAGSIGQAVTKELFKRNPIALHVVDISENNLVELVRDIRSSLGYIKGDFKTFAIDAGSPEFRAFLSKAGAYDYVLNLSALKHVRAERDPFTLMRMVRVNVINAVNLLDAASAMGAEKYFCVSTDKASNPVNLMGATKRIMELFLMQYSASITTSSSRFANVAFSDGSLLAGFRERLAKRQPISAPVDVTRYFITPKESAELCLLSCLCGDNRTIFFPKESDDLRLTGFRDIAARYLRSQGFELAECYSEAEARAAMGVLPQEGRWPCYFFESDTTGEKEFEEFYTDRDLKDMGQYKNIGVIHQDLAVDKQRLENFLSSVSACLEAGVWSKHELVMLIEDMIPELWHKETGKYLDERM